MLEMYEAGRLMAIFWFTLPLTGLAVIIWVWCKAGEDGSKDNMEKKKWAEEFLGTRKRD